MSLLERLKSGILLFDGAMGTMLQKRGLPSGGLPELFNLTHPEIVRSIHEEYVAAGADVITANTFQANTCKLADEDTVEAVIHHGISLAKASGAPFVALDMGPLGQMFEPLGSMTFDRAYAEFKRQVVAAEQAGADCVIIETFGDLLEAKIAVLAVKENSKLPVFATLSFDESGRTFMGVHPLCATLTLQGLGVTALGVNCSLGPAELFPIVERMLEYATVPVMVQANAGLPTMVEGEAVYTITAERFAEHVEVMLDKGVAVIGGCCGTTPEFIGLLDELRSTKKRVITEPLRATTATSATKTVFLERKVTPIGENISTSNRPAMQEALLNGDIDFVTEIALDQVDAGAKILDINLCSMGEKEEALQTVVVREIQALTAVPLQIDSANPKALEAGLRGYNGKPILNSVNGAQQSMDKLFPIAKKYGATVVCMTFDEKGIPKTADGLFVVAEKIISEAEEYGIPREDIIIDCLVLPELTSPQQKQQTLRATQRVKNELKVATTLGISNVSFGGSDRQQRNAAFLASALEAGLDAPILNALSPATMAVVEDFNRK